MHLTIAVAPLILTLGSLAPTRCEVPQTIEIGGCLLAHRSVTFSRSTRTQNDRHRLKDHSSKHHSWSVEHRRLERAANESQGALERFITGQAKSDDACSARLMEAKRALDGLLRDLNSLTQQVKSQEQILKTETENLNITHLAIESLDEQFKEDMEACQAQKEEARTDVQDLEKEMQELIQIAKPGVRYEHAVAKLSLLATSQLLWDAAQCRAFVKLAMNGALSTPVPTRNMSCDTQRQELQDAYTDAVNSVRNLMKDAKDREMDSTCADLAAAKQTSEKVPLIPQRDQAAERISASSEAITLLEPVLNMVRTRTEALEKHIEETLKPECVEVSHVSHALSNIRNLIISLEKCPGRNDFKLKIPDDAEGSTSKSSEGPVVATAAPTTTLKPSTSKTASTSHAVAHQASTQTTTTTAATSTEKVSTSRAGGTTTKRTPTATSAPTTTLTTTTYKISSTGPAARGNTTSAAPAASTTTMPIHGPEEPIHEFGGPVPEDTEVSALESEEEQDESEDDWASEW